MVVSRGQPISTVATAQHPYAPVWQLAHGIQLQHGWWCKQIQATNSVVLLVTSASSDTFLVLVRELPKLNDSVFLTKLACSVGKTWAAKSHSLFTVTDRVLAELDTVSDWLVKSTVGGGNIWLVKSVGFKPLVELCADAEAVATSSSIQKQSNFIVLDITNHLDCTYKWIQRHAEGWMFYAYKPFSSFSSSSCPPSSITGVLFTETLSFGIMDSSQHWPYTSTTA